MTRALLGMLALVYLLSNLSFAETFDVTGVVKDEASQPVSGAMVWLNQNRVPRKSLCDESGRFRFGGVEIGSVELTAWKEGYAVGGLDAKVVGSADVSIVLSSPDSVQVRLIERAMNTDSGTAGPPRAVAGARIKSMFVNDSFHVSVEDLSPLGFPGSRSDDSGLLTIANLPRGGFLSFLITHREYAEVYIPYYPVGQKELAIQVARGVTVTGRVTDRQGTPLDGVRVTVYHSGPKLQEAKEVKTSADGFYTAILPMGDFYVWAKYKNYVCLKPVPLSLTAEKEEYICDLTLDDAHRIQGQVVGTNDKPVAGVTVQYVVDSLVLDETLTSNKGEFSLEGGSGTGQVHVVPPDGYVSEYVTDIPVTLANEDIRVEKPVRLKELPVVEGVVKDAKGALCDRVVISTIEMDPPAWCVTDESGKFRLRLERAPIDGKARLRAEHAFRFERSDVEVSMDNLEPTTIQLDAFEPDTSECQPGRVTNKLASYRDRPAKGWDCDHWFNVSQELQDKPDSVTLESLKGKVVVLVFWAEFDNTQRGVATLDLANTIAKLYSPEDDVAVIGIHDSGSEIDEIKKILKDRDVRFIVGHDRESHTFSAYNIFAIPQILLIDKKGILRYYDVDGRLLELIKSLRREGTE
ncbi:MAG: carboxypeptidase regulatory-like domain-containing protein [Candidatus Hydrogenedentes bacterium]|nr:carboxypeptidase regulatory-like domain-containing protein [Candidatus Hydrogenedentota bacterium]